MLSPTNKLDPTAKRFKMVDGKSTEPGPRSDDTKQRELVKVQDRQFIDALKRVEKFGWKREGMEDANSEGAGAVRGGRPIRPVSPIES